MSGVYWAYGRGQESPLHTNANDTRSRNRRQKPAPENWRRFLVPVSAPVSRACVIGIRLNIGSGKLLAIPATQQTAMLQAM